MKPNLKKQIESSQKGIDYVNSLVPKNNEIGLSWEIAERAMKNNLTEEFDKMKRKKEQNRFAMFIFVCVVLGIVLYVALIIYFILEKL